MEIKEKIVEFERYCKDCSHKKESDAEDPCNECLANGYSPTGPIPINFEKKK